MFDWFHNKVPYTDFQQKNLDWLTETVREGEAAVEAKIAEADTAIADTEAATEAANNAKDAADTAAAGANAAATAANNAKDAANTAAANAQAAADKWATPYASTTVAGMTDHDKIYVYTGSEAGYTAGNWYYWNGSAWTSGGVYVGDITDAVLFNTSQSKSDAEKAQAQSNIGMPDVVKDVDLLKTTLAANNFDYSDVELVHYSIGPSGVWTYTISGNVRSYTFPITGYNIIKVTGNATNGSLIAFLNTYVPVTGEDVDFSTTYNTRITLSANETKTYIVSGDMNYLFALIRDSSNNDKTPTVEITTINDKQAVRTDPQTLTAGQSEQARINIDSVGNDTLYKYNFYDVLELGNGGSGVNNGITYTRNSDNTWTISGTATDNSFRNIVSSSGSLPRYIIPGRKYRLSFNGGSVPIRIYIYVSGVSSFTDYTGDTEITLPDNMTGIVIRYQIASGTVITDAVTVKYSFIPETVTSIDNYYTYNTTVEQTVNQITNTYDLDVSPSITTDTNGWLAAVDTESSSDSDKTDMTSSIMAMLNSTGYCHLGEGIFYVSGDVDMPEGSTLEGCGQNTIIRLLSSVSTGYCVKICKYNTVSNLRISGAYTTPTITSQGTRTGILFEANDDGNEGDTTFDSECCMITNVWIDKFTDSGIKCHNTSQSPFRGVYTSNLYIDSCWAGINIDYNSEFHKFTNVCTRSCYYGCINNGGNNVFSACTFHASYAGFYIDGSQPNASHGTLDGCTFCHIGSNNGIALKLDDIVSGFIISNCQIWYCSVDITNSQGILFSGCEFGRGTATDGNVCASISIDGGNLVMFSGCTFHLDTTRPPHITITNNTKTVFSECYGTQSGNLITAS